MLFSTTEKEHREQRWITRDTPQHVTFSSYTADDDLNFGESDNETYHYQYKNSTAGHQTDHYNYEDKQSAILGGQHNEYNSPNTSGHHNRNLASHPTRYQDKMVETQTAASHQYGDDDMPAAPPPVKRKRFSAPADLYMETTSPLSQHAGNRYVLQSVSGQQVGGQLENDENRDPNAADTSTVDISYCDEFLSPMDVATLSQTMPKSPLESPPYPPLTDRLSMSETKAKYRFLKTSLGSPAYGGRMMGVAKPLSYSKSAEELSDSL